MALVCQSSGVRGGGRVSSDSSLVVCNDLNWIVLSCILFVAGVMVWLWDGTKVTTNEGMCGICNLLSSGHVGTGLTSSTH